MSTKKRGYFFLLDAMLGLLVLIVGVFLITSSYVKVPQPIQVGLLSGDLLNFISNTKIKELNNPYAGIGGELQTRGYITEIDNPLLQQIGEFYEKDKVGLSKFPLPSGETEPYLDVAEKFIQNISGGVIPLQYRYEVWINGALLYPKTPTSEHTKSRENTKLLLTSKKLIFGIIDKRTGDIWGPYKAEVFIWES